MTEILPKILIVLGPTACGKTALSLELAQHFGGEIISADSMQVYRGMDIGSAKIPQDQRRGIPHHLLDIVPPEHSFSVADFRLRADECIADIVGRGKLPVICGGTGLYINALTCPCNYSAEADSDEELRLELQQEYRQLGGDALHERLSRLDPAAAAKIHPNDSRRLIRALEVYTLTGRPISSMQQENQPVPYDPVMVGLTAPRELMYERIERRVDEMLEQGLEAEVRSLLEAGVSKEAVSMQGLGYKQLAMYFDGSISFDEAVELIKRDTRRFSKRQMTWFKRDQRTMWFSIDQYLEEGELVRAVISRVADKL